MLLLLGAELFPQKLLLLENVHNMRNFKYYEGNSLIFKLSESQAKITDNIFNLTDSTIIFEGIGEVRISKICCIYRENWAIVTLGSLSLIGGAAYFGIDSFNRMINHEYPVVQTETMLISGGMIAFGLALIPFRYRKISITENWRLKTCDPESFHN
jgi:hypothetical protein